MRTATRLLLAASLLLVPAGLLAQTAVDPSGHWTGAIHVPPFNGAGSREIGIEIDLTMRANGTLDARFSEPSQNIKGLPLSKVAATGRTVSFELKVNGGGLFQGTLTDATTISGDFVTTEGGYNVPFDLKRTGDAQIPPAPRSARIGKELEGTWNGTVAADGKQERLVLKMANQPDGSATGTIIDLDGSAVEIPVGMTQNGSAVTVDIASVGATFEATLNADNELVGTWKQGPVALPLTFKRGTK